MNRESKIRAILLLLPCSLTAFFSVIYSFGIIKSFQISSINILTIAFIALNLAVALSEKVNVRKACGFVGSSAIGWIVAALNVFNDIPDGVFSFDRLSFWSWVWLVLSAVSVISLFVILVRMIFWDQSQWEEVKKWRQEYRRQRMQEKRDRRKTRLSYKDELSKEKHEAKIDKQKDKSGKDAALRGKKHDRRLERLDNWKVHFENVTGAIFRKGKPFFAFIVSLFLAIMFVLIPYPTTLQTAAFDWIEAVGKLGKRINFIKTEDSNNFFSAFGNYIVFYIILIFAIWAIWYFFQYIYRAISGRGGKAQDSFAEERKSLLEEYASAISVLTVFTSLLFAFGNSESIFVDASSKWAFLLLVILFILVIFVAVEVVRLVIEQIGQKGSLLKKLVHLIFIAILELVSGLLLGTIINIKIEAIVSSLLDALFPQDELLFANDVQERFQRIFSNELDREYGKKENNNVNSDADMNSGAKEKDNSPALLSDYRKCIWRRYSNK